MRMSPYSVKRDLLDEKWQLHFPVGLKIRYKLQYGIVLVQKSSGRIFYCVQELTLSLETAQSSVPGQQIDTFAGNHNQTQCKYHCILWSPFLVHIPRFQILPLWLKEYPRRGGKNFKSQNTRKFAMKKSLLDMVIRCL